MAVIYTLPGTIKISNEFYTSSLRRTYMQIGCSEYASTIYAEENLNELWLQSVRRRVYDNSIRRHKRRMPDGYR